MITQLTVEQEARLIAFQRQTLEEAIGGKKPDRARLEDAVTCADIALGRRTPPVTILHSPSQAALHMCNIESAGMRFGAALAPRIHQTIQIGGKAGLQKTICAQLRSAPKRFLAAHVDTPLPA